MLSKSIHRSLAPTAAGVLRKHMLDASNTGTTFKAFLQIFLMSMLDGELDVSDEDMSAHLATNGTLDVSDEDM